MDKYFLIQIKRTNGTIEKGVAVKDSLNEARQSYHAYLGAYGYGHDANTDYVMVEIIDGNCVRYDWTVDDRIPTPEPEPEPEEQEE